MADSLNMTDGSNGLKGWSTNMVEHLRGVHVLLFVASVGLILVTLSAKPYTPATALTQLEEIQRLQKDWSPGFLYAQVLADRLRANQIGSLGETGEWTTVPTSPPYSFHCKDDTGLYDCVPDRNWWAHFNDPYDPTVFPKTIAEFREFWNGLQTQEQWVDFVNQIGDGQVAGTIPVNIAVSPIDENVWTGGGLSRKEVGTQPQKKLWLQQVKKDQLQFWNAPIGVGYTWTIPVLTFRRCTIDQKGLIKIVRSWKEGTFDLAFRNLAEASRGLEELEFSDLRKQLETEAGQGSELFELAGIKIPSDQLTSSGIVAVLTVQFYFLILLRVLFGKLHREDSGWDEPWIGMYSSPLSQFATWLGAAVCPITAVTLLAWHGHSQVQSTIARALYIVSPLLSVLFAGASWIFRPTVSTASSEAVEGPNKTAAN